MFFDDASRIMEISKKAGTAIFVLPDDIDVNISGAILLEPEEKSFITIEQVRNLILRLNMNQTDDLFVIIRPAEKLNEEATNALLKTLEEPHDKVHVILITSQLSMLIPTVISRSLVYIMRQEWRIDTSLQARNETKELAKKLLVAKSADLPNLVDLITKKKDNVRSYTLDVLSIAIEMAYKSYFLTKKNAFLDKLEKLICAYDSISKNGHIKLHLVADLC